MTDTNTQTDRRRPLNTELALSPMPMPGLFVLHDDLPPGAKIRGLIRLVNEYDIEFYGPVVLIESRGHFRR